MWRNCTTILRNTTSDVQKSGNKRKGEVTNTPGYWELLCGVFTQKCIYGIGVFFKWKLLLWLPNPEKQSIYANAFQFYRTFLHSEFSTFFWTQSCMVITQNGRNKLWGHHACLGDIMQNMAKMGIFCSFPRGAWGEFYRGWLKSNKFQSLQLTLPNVNLFI